MGRVEKKEKERKEMVMVEWAGLEAREEKEKTFAIYLKESNIFKSNLNSKNSISI